MFMYVWLPLLIWGTIGCLLPDEWVLPYFGITSVGFLLLLFLIPKPKN